MAYVNGGYNDLKDIKMEIAKLQRRMDELKRERDHKIWQGRLSKSTLKIKK